MLLNLNRFASPVFLKETHLLTVFTLPMLLAQVAQVGIGFVDTVIAGGTGKEDLAAVALSSSTFSTVYITFMGVMATLNPMIAQLYDAGKTGEVGKIGMQGIWFGLCSGTFDVLLMWAMVTPFRHWLTLNDYVEDTMAQYMFFTSLTTPTTMIRHTLYAYASSLNRPHVIILVSFATFVLNVSLNYVFVYGKFGMPALGGTGCGVTTMAVFRFSALALRLYIAKEKFFRPSGLTVKIGKPGLTAFKQIWKIGVPIGLSYFLEANTFSFIVFLVVSFGEDYVTAQQVVISLSEILYIVPQNVGSTSTVRVGFPFGRRDSLWARYISGVSLVSGWMLATYTALLLIILRFQLAGVYTNDTAVLSIAATALFLASLFQLADATQCIASYTLRGYRVTKMPVFIHVVAFWGCGLLLGYLLAYYVDMGTYDFWTVLTVSLVVVAIALVWCLELCSKKRVKSHKAV